MAPSGVERLAPQFVADRTARAAAGQGLAHGGSLGPESAEFNAGRPKSMDLGAARHYVAHAMGFLLILSALLSAATGAFGGTRAPEAAARQEAAAEAVAIAEAAAAVAAPAEANGSSQPTLARQAAVEAAPAAGPAESAPLDTDRLIE